MGRHPHWQAALAGQPLGPHPQLSAAHSRRLGDEVARRILALPLVLPDLPARRGMEEGME